MVLLSKTKLNTGTGMHPDHNILMKDGRITVKRVEFVRDDKKQRQETVCTLVPVLRVSGTGTRYLVPCHDELCVC